MGGNENEHRLFRMIYRRRKFRSHMVRKRKIRSPIEERGDGLRVWGLRPGRRARCRWSVYLREGKHIVCLRYFRMGRNDIFLLRWWNRLLWRAQKIKKLL